EWLEDFLAEQSLGYDRLVLGGFSQGGVMSYALGLGKGRPRPAALTVFSSFIPRVDGFGFDLSPPLPPVAIGHGTLDPVIGVEWGRQAREVLEAAGAEVLYRETPMGHQIDPSFVGEVAEWRRGIIPPRGGRRRTACGRCRGDGRTRRAASSRDAAPSSSCPSSFGSWSTSSRARSRTFRRERG